MALFKTVHGKLSLALLVLLLLVGALCAGLTLLTTRTYIREVNQGLNRALASQLAKHLISRDLLRTDPANRRLTRKEIGLNMVLNPDIEIYILDDQGRILDFSGAPGEVQATRVALAPLQRFLGGVGTLPIYGDDPRHPDRQKIFSAARIPAPEKTATRNTATRNTATRNTATRNTATRNTATRNQMRGFIYIILGGQQYDATAGALDRSYILRWSLSVLAGVLGLAALVGVLFFGFLTRRLRRLTRDMDEFGARHLGGVAAITGNSIAGKGDEIEHLERMFARMSQHIEAQITTLQQSDAYRREVVSNVSHDLRTPLAALQGYLETLQMKEDLSDEQKREYLMTATRQAQRLGKLIAELFDLARLESGTLQLQLEEFSFAELVQDVAQQFVLVAQNKGVQLEIELGQARPFVRGDIGLIERAMENLIDNALRHTPSGGRVTVVLVAHDNRAGVRVCDTGKGIAPEQLPHIFDRHYRAPRFEGHEPSGGAGLGLAITKRIAELHGGSIEARSVAAEGATFTLDLPVALRQ